LGNVGKSIEAGTLDTKSYYKETTLAVASLGTSVQIDALAARVYGQIDDEEYAEKMVGTACLQLVPAAVKHATPAVSKAVVRTRSVSEPSPATLLERIAEYSGEPQKFSWKEPGSSGKMGYFEYVPLKSGGIHITHYRILSEFQKQGAGAKMLQDFIGKIKPREVSARLTGEHNRVPANVSDPVAWIETISHLGKNIAVEGYHVKSYNSADGLVVFEKR
jgi:predicted GNAT family acetyltransferase